MTIAVMMDHIYEVKTAHREGIGVFTNYLCKALLDVDPNIKIEFWQYSFNTPHMKKACKLATEAYPNRVVFFDEDQLCLWRVLALLCVRVFFRVLKSVFHISAPNLRDTLKQQIIEPALLQAIKKHSKASAFYVPYLLLPVAACLEGVKIVQIHDLFTLTLRDVFAQNWDSIDSFNANVLKTLSSYVEVGSYFISSTGYTKKEILKYLPQAPAEAIVPIAIPPMIGDFRDVGLEEAEKVKEKYGINGRYTFMASQNRPNKNWTVLLKALAHLRDEGIEIKMVTTGEIGTVKGCSRFYDELNLGGVVIETGALPTEDLAALYKGATMVAVPTMIEGYGMSGQGLEALKAGVPVIHSRSLGMEESLASVGLSFETADLNWFECDDDLALAVNIKKVLADPQLHIQRQKHILAAYTDITWQDTAREYLKIFYKGLNTSKGGDSGNP